MKKLIMIAVLLTGMTAMAQRHDMKEGRKSAKDLTAEQIATLQTKRMTLALDLTDAQQAKMKTLLTKDAEERKAKMEELKAKRKNDEKLTAEEKYAMQNERLDKQIAHKKAIKSILSDEQYAKWEKMQKRRGMDKKEKKKRGREARK
ncbi:hypothetical protein J8L85_15205 [Maribacter sp. MMG018]|uniref:hypothetical protein n=1 Tax=Maribacter sp. MMG018 TaxID=2822688 RepID=UPI001B3881F4|nr:hypothetical protein [Maribacter sp. MMG018]MBQ4915802.1 hypothetical protein [Maribacter sp. MMG018]